MSHRIRLGMVGGGQGAFIGAVHRIAARLDDKFELVAGSLSSDPERGAASAKDIGLPRTYASYEEMAVQEAARPDGIQAVAIVTPNHMHAPVATAFLKAGIHVICDKPLTAQMDEALALQETVEQSEALFILTHNYTGYPLIREARDMVARGDLGDLRLVQVEYLQDWLTEAPEPDQKQAAWRLDPAQAGSGALGDIGSHAFNLASFVTGDTVTAVSADVSRTVAGRLVDDNVHAHLRFVGGAKGALWASQIAVGHENGLSLRIYGSKASIRWCQEIPNQMSFAKFGEPVQTLTRGGANVGGSAARVTRIPGGHPEGYLEAFATLYSEAALMIHAQAGGPALPEGHHFNSVADGVAGMKFIGACLTSSENDGEWTPL